MNKKFSTLAVAAMLASAFTAYAGPGDVVTYLTKGNNGKAYQLVTEDAAGDTQYLVLNGNDQLALKPSFVVTGVNESSYTLGGSLWCVDVTLENNGKTIIYDFTNKAHGDVLDVTVGGYSTDWGPAIDGVYYKELDRVGGEISGWAFAPVLGSSTVKPNANGDNSNFMFDTNNPESANLKKYALRSYITSNKVATLVWGKNNTIKVAVVSADELGKVIPSSSEVGTENKEIQFFLKEASPVDLTAEQFNTILHTQEAGNIKLTFDKDYNNTDIVNPFSTNELMAENDMLVSGHNFVNLYKTNADATKNYLRVDTAYANDYGINFLKFAFSGNDDKVAYNSNSNPIKNQYNFRLNYCPTDDSLSIQVQEARYLKEGAKWWNTVDANGNLTGISAEVEKYLWNGAEADADNVVTEPKTGYVHNWVKLQDLVKEQEIRIITVGKKPINTHVSFGFGDCTAVQAEYTSVADGVYFIKNAKGQYLAHPIYNNGDEAPLFVTVNADEQNVEHMPAYQWVVLKEYTETTGTKKFSPVKIANREFDEDFAYTGIQLKQSEGAKYMYVGSNKISGTDYIVATDSLEFVKVSDASVKDRELGYLRLEKDELAVNKYTFNYWHPYADDKFIAQSSKDSTLTVFDGKEAFKIDSIAENRVNKYTSNIEYGFGKYMTDAQFAAVQKRIPELAQLVRTAYYMTSTKTANEWRINKEEKFNVGNDDNQQIIEFPVFFKENNQIGDKCYHALVQANPARVGIDEFEFRIIGRDENLKAGVSDYDGAATLKKQLLNETRTSAFYIAPDETPLYRRFNSTLEGQAGDAVDTLRFYEKYRNEYLMIEANKNFMVEHIDFLGIDAQDKAQGGLAFIVDTAWVNRGFGNIKPQYLISIDRHDYQGVAGEPCTEAGPHIDESGHITDDPMECVHAHKSVPGFKRGKFLINFHDFANGDDMVNADDYKWAEYDRAGFKEAIVYKDTLYVLRDEFKNLKNEEIDLAKLASAEVEALKAWTSAGNTAATFHTYKYVLTGDEHKYATWSMRFVDRSVAANEVEADRAFLFESMNGDGLEIAPAKAAWLKMQNGCLVLSDKNTSKFDEVVTGGDDALIFNVEHVCGDKVAVDNENIAVEGVSVVAGNGQVTIMGAAGKNVTITNILGKVIANQTISSDNATIAVPAGIVAVAVEGEAAVKAIVK